MAKYTILKPSRNPTKHIPIIIPKIILQPSFAAISPSEVKKNNIIHGYKVYLFHKLSPPLNIFTNLGMRKLERDKGYNFCNY